MCGVVAHDEGARIGSFIGCSQTLLLAQLGNVSRLLADTVVEGGLVSVARVDDEHTFVGQYEEGWIVVVIGLEVAAYEYVLLLSSEPVVLSGLDIAVHIDVTDVRHIDGTVLVLIVYGTRVGKPAPSPFAGYVIAAEAVLSVGTEYSGEYGQDK